MNLTPDPLSKRIKISALIVIVALALLYVATPKSWLSSSSQGFVRDEPLPVIGELVAAQVNEDADGDSIPAWKEALYGTNPNIKDDASLFSSKAPQTPEEQSSLSRLSDSKNLTSQFIKNTVGLSTYLDSQGVSDAATIEQVSTNILDESVKLSESRTFTKTDLKVSQTENFTSIKAYGNSLAKELVGLYGVLDINNILSDLDEYTKTNDPKKLQAYGKKADVIRSAINTLLTLSIPPSAIESQLYLINTLESYRSVLYGLAKGEQDPLEAILALNSFKGAHTNMVESIFVLAKYFTEKSVVFGPKEPGIIFTQVILIQ